MGVVDTIAGIIVKVPDVVATEFVWLSDGVNVIETVRVPLALLSSPKATSVPGVGE